MPLGASGSTCGARGRALPIGGLGVNAEALRARWLIAGRNVLMSEPQMRRQRRNIRVALTILAIGIIVGVISVFVEQSNGIIPAPATER